MEKFKIHPSVGVARLGNSTDSFYLAPEETGGLPIECDAQGNEKLEKGKPVYVKQFKDGQKRIRRQGAKFRIFRYDKSPEGVELTLNDPDIKNIEWNVHIANKKAGFWNFAELVGNTMISPQNTYENGEKKGFVTLRNETVKGKTRQKLIIDPGPRSLSGSNKKTDFSKSTAPPDYQFTSFPGKPQQGLSIDTLGSMLTDKEGRLVIVAAYGNAGGNDPITSYAGADTWHDDTADGQVNCKITFKNGEVIELDAWVICASPKYAPQLVNISTIADLMLDLEIRFRNYDPGIFNIKKWPKSEGWNTDYIVNFDRDIAPILNRPKDYIWVSNVPSMLAFTNPPFNVRDNSPDLNKKRKTFFSYWRKPFGMKNTQVNDLWDNRKMPLMPHNSGTNSVTNEIVQKFLTLTPLQYFFLGQWAEGKFNDEKKVKWKNIHSLDQASVGNCAGLPQSPGIETTWSINNPALYRAPFRIKHAHDNTYYKKNGLSPLRDETKGGGCEPGDLSKRMAIPWPADFFQCTIELVNFTNPNINVDEYDDAIPPSYYAYWWPPQAPWDVISGNMTPLEQFQQGIPAGVQVNYARGINSFGQMIKAWKYLGFIVNQNEGDDARDYPYFVEKERNDEQFEVASVAVGGGSVYITGDDTTFNLAWYLKDEFISDKESKEPKGVLPVKEELERRRKKIKATLGKPRSHTKVRF